MDKQNYVTSVLGAVSSTMAGVGYAETLQTVYLVLTIIAAVATIISLVIGIVIKVKNDLKDHKLDDNELTDLKGDVDKIVKVVDDTKDAVKKEEDKTDDHN
jgi:hypothetical protein